VSPDWPLERFRSLLRLQVRLMRLNPRFHLRFDASDLVHETMVRAWEHRDQFRGGSEGQALAWLRAILRNVVADKLDQAHAAKADIDREQSIRAVDDSSARMEALLVSKQPSPPEEAERREQLVRLAEAIERLPENQREAVIRHRLLSQPVAEVAAGLCCTESAVAGLLYRGQCKLAELLNGAG
jgi:RNA polymerase sigma-70 factor (ECF subfamily)